MLKIVSKSATALIDFADMECGVLYEIIDEHSLGGAFHGRLVVRFTGANEALFNALLLDESNDGWFDRQEGEYPSALRVRRVPPGTTLEVVG